MWGGEIAEQATALGALAAVQSRLHSATSVGELLADAADLGREVCGFERGVVLTVRDGELGATGIPRLADPASDRLRRIALECPVALSAGSDEAELIRRGGRFARACPGLEQALELEAYAVAAIAPESRPLAVLVLDRAERAVDDGDRARVELFAHLLGLAVERVVLRSRLTDLALELRHF